MLILVRLHERQAVPREIWAATQRLLWDRGKWRKNLIGFAGRRTFQMRADFQPAVRLLNTRALIVVPNCPAAFFKYYINFLLFVHMLWLRSEQLGFLLIRLLRTFHMSLSVFSQSFRLGSPVGLRPPKGRKQRAMIDSRKAEVKRKLWGRSQRLYFCGARRKHF
jgi:hypothetical protein